MSIIVLPLIYIPRIGLTGPAHLLRTTTLAPLVSQQIRYRSRIPRPSPKVAMNKTSPDSKANASAEDGSLTRVLDASWKHQISLAEGQDESRVINALESLLAGGAQNHPWYMCLNGKGIQRSFHFKTFKQTWDFMQAVADKCKSERHHPEWWNAYNHTFIQWTTHRPEGLTIKDVEMAAFCNEQAARHAELEGQHPTLRRLFGVAEAEM